MTTFLDPKPPDGFINEILQRDQQNQTDELKQPSEGRVPKRSQTLFVKEADADTLPGIQIASETPAIPSNTAPTPKVCRKFIMAFINHISDNFTDSTRQ